jgi:hypothetical protein
MLIIGKVCKKTSACRQFTIDFHLVIEIGICVILGIGIIIALVFYNRYIYIYVCLVSGNKHRNFCRIDQEKSDSGEENKINFLTTSADEELLVQNVLTYYEHQRKELIERQK